MKILKWCFLVLFPLMALVTFAQTETVNDPKADAILTAVAAKYKANKTAKVVLDLVIDLPEMEDEENIPVTFWMKGDMFKIELPDQTFISDNVTLWNYMEEYDEVQINNYDESDALFSPSVIFDVYSDKYVYRVKEEYKKDGVPYSVIEMVPVDKEQEFFKIDLVINTATSTIVESKMFEKSGTHTVFKITTFTANVDLSDDFFQMNTDKVGSVVDLRY